MIHSPLPPENGSADTVLPSIQKWPVLVVDDDESVLQISRMVLSRLEVMGRPLELFMARTGDEARVLCEMREFAAAIVDVVMESDTAGLDFIAWLRARPNGRATRVVVRTGQPGQAPEEQILRDYEINDYWLKTELTARRIRTIMTGLIRSYHDLLVVQQQRKDVSEILVVLPELFRQHSVEGLLAALTKTARNIYGNKEADLLLIDFGPDGLEHGRVIASTQEQVPPAGVPLQDKLKPEELELLRLSESVQQITCQGQQIGLLIRSDVGQAEALLGRGWPALDPCRKALGDLLARNALLILESHLLKAQHQQKLEEQLRRDELTGLNNRRGLLSFLLTPQPPNRQGYLVLLHVDSLDAINDAYGQTIGDQVLIKVATRLRTFYGPTYVARLDGGTFALYIDDETSSIEHVLHRLQQLFEPMLKLLELLIPITLHLGVAQNHETSPFELLHQASQALKVARRQTAPRYAYYDPTLAAIDLRTAQLQTGLQKIQLADELRVVFQPIVSLNNGRIMGAESLVRWNSHQFGMVSPMEFIPVAERCGLITELTRFVLQQALQALDLWQPIHPSLYITVNISPLSMNEESFVPMVLETLGNRSTESLWLEITESERMSQESICRENMLALKARGIRFMIDDFGTGYSSLSYLNRLPFDALKVDRSFVTPLEEKEATSPHSLLQAIMGVAASFNLAVTAEGVETSNQAKALQDLRCRLAQGYLFSKPVTAEAFEALLVNEKLDRGGDS